ncbi:hypothetical protein PWG15_12480 [Ensifer adhaerens]|uniref:hypothetical protein n=1 Tax=Ensifer adhaerens TaxID=106592 RepID=UPI0023A97F0F|nr:hypothetical protein [Ensifer adhaerens]WDZ75433.1 hypothetical protein PWG15_12480 [Ensifer adhaerens]
MYERYTYDAPERKFTTGLPVGVMLLSMVVIAAYLLFGGASIDSKQTTSVVLPKSAADTSR